MKTVYKLTDQNMQTYGNCQWVLNEWKETSGEGDLCRPGWLPGYSDPLIAILHNPMHANIANPRMFVAEVEGKYLDDGGLKCGHTRMRLIEEINPPVITVTQKIAYAILCAREVCTNKKWNDWADGWLSGNDRSAEAAWAAARAEEAAAEEAAWAAWGAAAAVIKTGWAAWGATAAAAAANKKKIDLIAIAKEAVSNY